MNRLMRSRGWAYPLRRRARRVWWSLQCSWWHLLETWPFSSMAVFFRSLPLLTLWLLTAYIAFRLLPPSLKTPDKETLSLFATIVAALVGFGVQQWKSLTEEERERRQKCQKALDEIADLGTLIRSEPSEAARRYVWMVEQGGIWKSGLVRSHLEAQWSAASPELQDAVELLNSLKDENEFYRVAGRLQTGRSVRALEWGLEHLDDEWKQKAAYGLVLLGQHPEHRPQASGQALQGVQQRFWRAILRPWPHISLWREFPAPVSAEVLQGLSYLGVESIPFGSGEAETDTLLLRCRVDPPWLPKLRQPVPAFVTGAPGSGKTATALLLAHDSLREQNAFPVYFPASLDEMELLRVAQVLARTLVCYLAVAPESFLKCGVAEKTAMAYLLARSERSDLPFRFHQAGLPRTGDGLKMLQEIEALAPEASLREPVTDQDWLALLGEARPYGFRCTILLVDIRQPTGGKGVTGVALRPLLELSEELARIGVFVKAFLPAPFRLPLQECGVTPVPLQWSVRDLSTLLENYLKRAGEDNLNAWCDLRDLQGHYVQQTGGDANTAWCEVTEGEASPKARLIRSAQGNPRVLIRKGNELLERVGVTGHLLEAQDLDEILGTLA